MARFTLSIADDVAAQLDAYAAENNLNRSQAAEHIFRSVFQPATDQADDASSEALEESPAMLDYGASLEDQLLEMRDYLTILYSRQESLRNYVMATTDYGQAPHGMGLPRTLPAPPWVHRAQS